MSEILKKYRERLKYADQLTESYKNLLEAALSHIRSIVRGNSQLEKTLASLIERSATAENIFQVEALLKEYQKVRKEINLALKEQGSGGGGGLLAGLGNLFAGGGDAATLKEPSPEKKKERHPIGDVPLVGGEMEDLAPYVTLLESYTKGALLLADDREPFYAPLLAYRRKKFDHLQGKHATALGRSLYNFFIHKANEAGLVENEREELKKIIALFGAHLREIAISNDKYSERLEISATRITKATSIDEIKQLQRVLLDETREMQTVNKSVSAKLAEAEEEMAASTERIAKLERDLTMAREEKSIDALTQLYNRGYLDERLEEAVTAALRDREALSLMMFDIDHFKIFNDTYGHAVGDQVLKIVSRNTRESVRASDTVARYGGEEFVVILYKTGVEQALKVAENVRANIEAHEFGYKGETLHVTVSIGVTELRAQDSSTSLLERADQGLYKGKEEGRNRVIRA